MIALKFVYNDSVETYGIDIGPVKWRLHALLYIKEFMFVYKSWV